MSWDEKDFLRMMKVNHRIFGSDIIEIESATDVFLIKYFKNSLCKLLDFYAKVESNLFIIKTSGKGDIEYVIPKDFELSKTQCIIIGNFILCGKVRIDMFGKPKISYWDSFIILNYIINGVDLYSNYRLVIC